MIGLIYQYDEERGDYNHHEYLTHFKRWKAQTNRERDKGEDNHQEKGPQSAVGRCIKVKEFSERQGKLG